MDFEAELGVVIGRPCKNVSVEEALSYVLGYAYANDVSARDWQKEKGGGQFCRGKTFDTFCPVGPCLATADEIPDPSKLTVRSFVNDEKMQESGTDDMIFDVPTLISFLSGSTTLLPGTLILTGTPSGVGEARDPKRYLVPGDEVTVEIDGVGLLTNPVVEEMDGEEEKKEKQFMKVAILQFPGSNCDWDSEHAVNEVLGIPAKRIWHKDKLPSEAEAVIVPGGFSFGDYLRCGAIARFSPIMKDLLEFADMGGQVLGICNGFQILCESGLLPCGSRS